MRHKILNSANGVGLLTVALLMLSTTSQACVRCAFAGINRAHVASSTVRIQAPLFARPPQYSKNKKRSFYGTPRRFEEWKVPTYVPIPEDQLDFTFTRSNGAGGQNVNKVNTCVQVRFHVDSASWMPYEVRQRFLAQNANSVTKEGVYWTEAQKHRTQPGNRKEVLSKIQKIVLAAWPRPVERKLRTGISEFEKERRKTQKTQRKQKKESRRPVEF